MSTMSTRTEKDFIGEKEIPAYAYYGIQTVRAVENFPITGVPVHRADHGSGCGEEGSSDYQHGVEDAAEQDWRCDRHGS